jgi:hypothetical protein
MPGFRDENPLPCRRAQHGGVERHLTAPIDGRDNRLRTDVKPVEVPTTRRGQTRPDGGAQLPDFGHGGNYRLRWDLN